MGYVSFAIEIFILTITTNKKNEADLIFPGYIMDITIALNGLLEMQLIYNICTYLKYKSNWF